MALNLLAVTLSSIWVLLAADAAQMRPMNCPGLEGFDGLFLSAQPMNPYRMLAEFVTEIERSVLARDKIRAVRAFLSRTDNTGIGQIFGKQAKDKRTLEEFIWLTRAFASIDYEDGQDFCTIPNFACVRLLLEAMQKYDMRKPEFKGQPLRLPSVTRNLINILDHMNKKCKDPLLWNLFKSQRLQAELTSLLDEYLLELDWMGVYHLRRVCNGPTGEENCQHPFAAEIKEALGRIHRRKTNGLPIVRMDRSGRQRPLTLDDQKTYLSAYLIEPCNELMSRADKVLGPLNDLLVSSIIRNVYKDCEEPFKGSTETSERRWMLRYFVCEMLLEAEQENLSRQLLTV